MGTIHKRAFDAVIRRDWERLKHKRREGTTHNRKGDLEPGATRTDATYDAFNYQRSHADAFKRALRLAKVDPPRSGHSLTIVDIGAGAATVGVAVSEVWSGVTERISYCRVEPNKHMSDLGRRLLSEMGNPFARESSYRSIDELDTTHLVLNSDRILVTLSYVLQQSAVDDEDVTNWVATIKSWSDPPNLRTVEVLATTVVSNDPGLERRDKLPMFLELLEESLPTLRVHGDTFRSDHRFPVDDSSCGDHWKPREVTYANVRYVYWCE